MKKFRDQWPITKMLQDRLRNRRVELEKLGLLQKTHRNYKTTSEQRSAQGKRANAISIQHGRARSAETNAVRQQERQCDVEHRGRDEPMGGDEPMM